MGGPPYRPSSRTTTRPSSRRNADSGRVMDPWEVAAHALRDAGAALFNKEAGRDLKWVEACQAYKDACLWQASHIGSSEAGS